MLTIFRACLAAFILVGVVTQADNLFTGSSLFRWTRHDPQVGPLQLPLDNTSRHGKKIISVADRGGGATKGEKRVLFERALSESIKDEKIALKVKRIVTEMPINDETRSKLRQAAKSALGATNLRMDDPKVVSLWELVSIVSTPIIEDINDKAAKNTSDSVLMRTTRPTLRVKRAATSTTKAPSSTKGPQLIGCEVMKMCDSCCEGHEDGVCLAPKCPQVPADRSKCADFPLCYPPCKLQVVANPDELFDDQDGSGEVGTKNSSTQTKRSRASRSVPFNGATSTGSTRFNRIVESLIKNETIRKSFLAMFDSMHKRVPVSLASDIEDVFKHFKDDGVTKLKPDSGRLVRSILGHAFESILAHRQAKAAKSKLKRSIFDEERANSSRLARSTHAHRRRHNRNRDDTVPFCFPCDGSCRSDLKSCSIVCPNNPGCLLGQCVCHKDAQSSVQVKSKRT